MEPETGMEDFSDCEVERNARLHAIALAVDSVPVGTDPQEILRIAGLFLHYSNESYRRAAWLKRQAQ